MAYPITVVLPENDEGGDLDATLASLSKQIYPLWAVAIIDSGDSVARQRVREVLGPERVVDACRWHDIESPFALALSPGDTLTVDALAEFAAAIMSAPDCRMVYADQIEYFGRTERPSAFFKPGWSPEFLLANNYVGRAALRIADFVGGLASGYDCVDIWKLLLSARSFPATDIIRIERILLHTRKEASERLERLAARSLNILSAYLAGQGIEGKPSWPDWAQKIGALSFDVSFPDEGPKVSIIIPSRNNWKILKRCIDSLSLTTYRDYDLILVDNCSDDPETLSYISTLDCKVVNIASPPEGFNYSYINNQAARQATGDFLLFLNDDTEVIAADWLSAMVGWTRFDGVATVGARLLFPTDRVQHAGLVHRLLDDVLPAPAFKLMDRNAIGPHAQDRTVRNYSALTAACLLTPRELFLSEGGFEETIFGVAYNDVDYGFRLTQQGYRHVFAASAELYHHEGASRGSGRGNDKVSEEINFIRKYRNWLDPHYSSHLRTDSFEFEPSVENILPESGAIDADICVVLVTHNLNFEGAPLVLLDIARGLVSCADWRVFVLSPVSGPLRERFEEAGCSVIVRDDLGVQDEDFHVDVLGKTSRLTDLLEDLSPDVVLANTMLTYWALFAAQVLGIPSVWFIHESEPPFLHLAPWGGRHIQYSRSVYENNYMNVFCSRATKELYQSISNVNNEIVIYNGFDTASAAREKSQYDRSTERRKLGISEEDFVFLTPGIVSARKGQMDVLKMATMLPASILRQAVFLIVGDRDGEYSASLHAELKKMPAPVRERIHLIKETPHIMRYYAMTDAVLFPSNRESFPRVIQESMALRLPIATTPVFGISELLRDGVSARFFAPGDLPGLRDSCIWILENRDKASKMGEQAQLSLGKFPGVDEMQKAYIQLLRGAAYSKSDRAFSTLVQPTVAGYKT